MILIIAITHLFILLLQVLRVSEMDLVSTIIRTEITLFDETVEDQKASDKRPDDEESNDGIDNSGSEPRIIHGSPLPPCSLSKLELDHSNDLAFKNARIKLSSALSSLLNVPRVTLLASDAVS